MAKEMAIFYWPYWHQSPVQQALDLLAPTYYKNIANGLAAPYSES